jgi:hypothetical protein
MCESIFIKVAESKIPQGQFFLDIENCELLHCALLSSFSMQVSLKLEPLPNYLLAKYPAG